MKAQQLWFTDPQRVEIREQQLPALASGQILVKTHCSAISAGTEQLDQHGYLVDIVAIEAALDGIVQDYLYARVRD